MEDKTMFAALAVCVGFAHMAVVEVVHLDNSKAATILHGRLKKDEQIWHSQPDEDLVLPIAVCIGGDHFRDVAVQCVRRTKRGANVVALVNYGG